MKHHFADLLDRQGNYWKLVPNVERFRYQLEDISLDDQEINIVTIGKYDENWERIYGMSNLEELTLHEPNKSQLEGIKHLEQLKRLRISHARPKSIEFISKLSNLEELVLEYVSGFSDLSPLNKLTKLKSIHLENLRRVNNFDGLRGIYSLKYLNIDGTLEWKQPIENFNFLEDIPNLEVFGLGWIKNESEYPKLKSLIKLKELKRIKIIRDTFKTEEFAFIEAALPNVEGAKWELIWEFNDWYEFLGKRAGKVKCSNPNANKRCNEFVEKYEKMKNMVRKELDNYGS
jgi:hypothetical protein